MLNVIVFSKDRACQLNALIESFLLYYRDLAPDKAGNPNYKMKVIYKASSPAFQEGYSELNQRLGLMTLPTLSGEEPYIQLIKETSFQADVIKSINEKFPLTMFLVDDILFKDYFSLSDKEIQTTLKNPQILATSLRLYEKISHCYATNTPSKVPSFVKGNVWKWKDAEGDWGYPYSVDGNVYRTKDILTLLSSLTFTNPNVLEAALSTNTQTGRPPEYLCCYRESSKLINIPANLVQGTYRNRHANSYTAEELNTRYLNGELISHLETTAQAQNNTTVHIELPFVWRKRW